jgi:glutamate-ammonia-ligase adenylyltransferase
VLSQLWIKVARASADPARVTEGLNQLAAAGPEVADFLARASATQAELLAAALAGSMHLAQTFLAHPEWLGFLIDAGHLQYPRKEQGLRRELSDRLQPLLASRDYAGTFSTLREFKLREHCRIAVRDLARLGNLPETIGELSSLADVCLSGALQVCALQFQERHGQPFHQDVDGRWQATPFCVLGMGKLGGQELNYSSDVDLLFVYGDEGQVFKEPPTKGKSPSPVMASHAYFNRLAAAFIGEVTRLGPEGFLFRVDMRLRPEGDAGPLCRSLGSYENYYSQWGQTWERMMLIKARCVAGDASLAGEFLEMIQPFRYPRFVGEGTLREIAAMKQRIENEVVRAGELDRNVKLGRGGIREIEFVVQAQQVLHAGRNPFLQGAQTLPLLQKLAQYDLLPEATMQQLAGAYCFLRDVEHRLQMEGNLQTHTIPTGRLAQERLARLMGFGDAKSSLTKPVRGRGRDTAVDPDDPSPSGALTAFNTALQQHMRGVRAAYEALLQTDGGAGEFPFPLHFGGAETEWRALLEARGFREPGKAFKLLREFVEGPGHGHISSRTTECARQMLARLLAMCPAANEEAAPARVLSDPDRVVARMDSFIAAYGARATLFEAWHSNPAFFDLLVWLFDRSEFLAELAIRTPDLVDELVAGDRLRQRKAAADILADLRHGRDDADQHQWLRRYHEAEFMRIGCREILGLADLEQHTVELTALADACLQYALEVVARRQRLKRAPFAIIGLGKLGGGEITYGSDLDIVFVAPDDPKELPKRQRLAVALMDLLSARTELGCVFATDARLRPDGEKGLLVNTLRAHADYYRQRAQLWELQAISRARFVAGDAKTGTRYLACAATLTDFRPARKDDPQRPACFTPDWKGEMHRMRLRIEKERTPAGQDELAIKTGRGGLMDAEFMAQCFCLAHGWQEPNTLRALERAQVAGLLPEAETFLESYRAMRRVEGILRRWSYEGETVLPDAPAPFQRVSVRCGFASAEAFLKALNGWRKVMREAYCQVFKPG